MQANDDRSEGHPDTARCGVLEDEIVRLRRAIRNILPYVNWTIGPESPGHHPTMPSAAVALAATLEHPFGAVMDTPDGRLRPATHVHRSHLVYPGGQQAMPGDKVALDEHGRGVATVVEVSNCEFDRPLLLDDGSHVSPALRWLVGRDDGTPVAA